MRTTLTLDEDVVVMITSYQQLHGGTFKDVVNTALRAGFAELDKPAPRKRFRTHAASLGRPLVVSLDNVAETLAVAEGENFA